MILTEKETTVLTGMMVTAFENMGGKTASELYDDNFSWNDMNDIKDKTEYKDPCIKGVLGSLMKKGVVGRDEDGFGKTLYSITDPGIDFLVTVGC